MRDMEKVTKEIDPKDFKDQVVSNEKRTVKMVL